MNKLWLFSALWEGISHAQYGPVDPFQMTCWTSSSFSFTVELMSFVQLLIVSDLSFPTSSNIIQCIHLSLYFFFLSLSDFIHTDFYLHWQHILDPKLKNSSCTFYLVPQLFVLNTIPFPPLPTRVQKYSSISCLVILITLLSDVLNLVCLSYIKPIHNKEKGVNKTHNQQNQYKISPYSLSNFLLNIPRHIKKNRWDLNALRFWSCMLIYFFNTR